jgi:hypothetical protein
LPRILVQPRQSCNLQRHLFIESCAAYGTIGWLRIRFLALWVGFGLKNFMKDIEMSYTVRYATLADVPVVGKLFDGYRQFYEQPADLSRATAYIQAR